MKPLQDIYKGSFFGRRDSMLWRVPIVCNAVLGAFELVKGDKLVDVGCAIGEFLAGFKEMGMDVYGLEGSPNALPYLLPSVKDDILIHDLRTPLQVVKERDLCMCLEVAEHIEEEYSGVFLDTLCGLSKKILITAAPPGQGGHYHVNCQPEEYWEERFRKRGYQRWRTKELVWRALLSHVMGKKGVGHYRENAMIYRRVK